MRWWARRCGAQGRVLTVLNDFPEISARRVRLAACRVPVQGDLRWGPLARHPEGGGDRQRPAQAFAGLLQEGAA